MTNVSVVIPVRNRFDHLFETLQSINQQEYTGNLEVILIDDSTESGIESTLSKFEMLSIKHIKNSTRAGIAGARNQGLELARRKYIAFLDSDDVWTPLFLQKSVTTLEKHSSLHGTLCLSQPFFDLNFPVFLKLKIYFLNLIKNCLIILSSLFNSKLLSSSAPFLGHCSHMVYRNHSLPRFDTHLKVAEDWRFILEVLKSQKIGIILNPLVRFRYSMRSNSFNISEDSKKTKRQGYRLLIDELNKLNPNNPLLKLFSFYSKYFLIG